jgi:hypothetical protein
LRPPIGTKRGADNPSLASVDDVIVAMLEGTMSVTGEQSFRFG